MTWRNENAKPPNYTWVLRDRKKPRIISLHRFVECGKCCALLVDKQAYEQHKQYHKFIEENLGIFEEA